MNRARLIAEWCVLLIGALCLVVASQQRGWTERLDLGLLDIVTSLAGGDPSNSVLLVEIDDKALAEQGNWPWDRGRHAALIEALAEQRPDVIAVDILFMDAVSGDGDVALGDAIARAGNVVLPHSFAFEDGTTDLTVPDLPIATIASESAALGHVAVIPDSDGIVRRFEPRRSLDGQAYPHLALQAAQLSVGQGVELPDFPADEAIAPYAGEGGFQSVSAADVMTGNVPEGFFGGRVVLVGATAQGLGDRYAVPAYAGRILSGMEIQANFVDGLLGGNLIGEASLAQILIPQILAVLLLFLIFWRLPPRMALTGSIGLIALLIVVTLLGVLSLDLWIPTGGGILAIIVAYPLWGWRRLATVSNFLEREAKALSLVDESRRDHSGSGFDVVARQVAEMKGLTREIARSLKAIRSILDASPDPMIVLGADELVAMSNEAAERTFSWEVDGPSAPLSTWFLSAGARLNEDRNELVMGDGRVFLVASADLDSDVGSRIIALRDISQIKANERQRQEMLEFLSHDMRSPQVAIIGLVGTAGRDLKPEERLSRISNHARRTLKLTDDFVQIARLRNEGLQIADTEVGSLVFEAADRAFPLARNKSISINTHMPDDPCFAFVDAEALSRVLDNLIGNAIKFSPAEAPIELSLQLGEGDTFSIRLSDKGQGLPPERLVDPFARFGANDPRAGPSAGLGLAYVKQVIDQHGGAIEVHSSPETGTSFIITLPYGEGASPAEQTEV